jgi:HD superfamily phosphodiesterase
MQKKFEKIWQLAIPYLSKGIKKDYLIHTKGVIKAMELLLRKEKSDENILIPAAILHDVGWYKISRQLQKSNKKKEKLEVMQLHLKYAPPVIKQVLAKLKYSKDRIDKIAEIVFAHKFQRPKELDKQLLIDADNLSDVFREQFESDIKSYRNTPKKLYRFREKNIFYTKTAREIFNKELEKRRKEVFGS